MTTKPAAKPLAAAAPSPKRTKTHYGTGKRNKTHASPMNLDRPKGKTAGKKQATPPKDKDTFRTLQERLNAWAGKP